MANYANQLTIKLDFGNTIFKGGNNNGEMFAPYMFWKYKKAAMKKLTGNGYKLWEYMYSWAGKESFELSPKHIRDEIGISDKGVRLARQELERFGCLKLEDGKVNTYIFTPTAIL